MIVIASTQRQALNSIVFISFATHMLENGVNIRVVQELFGYADVKTTETYTHVMEKDISNVITPLDTEIS